MDEIQTRRRLAIDEIAQQIVTSQRSNQQTVTQVRSMTDSARADVHSSASLLLALDDVEAAQKLLLRAHALVVGSLAADA